MHEAGMHEAGHCFGTVIIGAGPAGTAVLLAACRNGELPALLDQGVAIIDASDHFGRGQIGVYAINSDSTAATFIDCLKNSAYPELQILNEHALARQFAKFDQVSVPLHLVGQLYALIGEALQAIMARHPACAIFLKSKVVEARQGLAGGWVSSVSLPNGTVMKVRSANLVLATGAHQPLARLGREMIGGFALSELSHGRLVQSGEVLQTGGVEKIAARLAGKADPKIAVIGGSTSAVAVAFSLLTRLSPTLTQPNAVTILHRHPLRLYYPSVAQALEDGYDDFTQADLCPLTGRVYRFAGLRLDCKDLIRNALRIGGRTPDPRLRLHILQEHDRDAASIIAGADVVIACLGYRPIGVPLVDTSGRVIELHAASSASAPLVDGKCRVIDASGRPLANVFGIGLAAGFMPRGALGGEPSFMGQANGLWLWQTAVGGIIIEQIIQPPALPDIVAFASANSNIGGYGASSRGAALSGD